MRQVINENYVMKLPTEKSHTDIKEKELRESSPTKLLMGWKQKIRTTSAVFLSELKEKEKEAVWIK